MTTETTPVPSAPAAAEPEMLTGSGAIIRTLELLGVTDVFGIPGGAVIPLYDELMTQTKIRHILVRHEQGAGHAAEGYASSTGRVGVAIATSGPGATNLVTAIADAYMDSVPLLAITGQVFSTSMGTDAFQEADIIGITMPITKHSFLARRAEEIPAAIASAYHIASTGRPGPVLVDITKDAQQNLAPFIWPPKLDLPGYRPIVKAHGKQVQAAAQLLLQAKKPVLYVGGGVIRAEASPELLALAEATGAPVVTTLMARGAFPDSHPQHLGMPGMHGTVPAVLALQESDLIISLGARFDDRVTGKISEFAPHAKIVHVDVDPAEISKIRAVDVPIVGDAKDVIADLTTAWIDAAQGATPDTAEWWTYLHGLKDEFPLGFTEPADGLLAPQYVIQRIGELTGPEAVYAAGVGQHQMWAAQYLNFNDPNRWMTSGGLGTMGYGFPASIGVQMAHPDALVINVAGEASWLMNMQEMGTAMQFRLPVKQFIMNNERLGMVRQWQELLHGERYSHSWSESLPDFVKLAEAFGAKGIRCSDPASLDDAIIEMLEYPGPVIFDCLVEKHENCFPMIPSGEAHNKMLLGAASTKDAIGTKGAVMV